MSAPTICVLGTLSLILAAVATLEVVKADDAKLIGALK